VNDEQAPEGWTVGLEGKEPTVALSDQTPYKAVWIDVEGPSDALSPTERLALTSQLAERAAREWAQEEGLGTPYLTGASLDSWVADKRFKRTHAYQAPVEHGGG
jgi:hypothetical protein